MPMQSPHAARTSRRPWRKRLPCRRLRPALDRRYRAHPTDHRQPTHLRPRAAHPQALPAHPAARRQQTRRRQTRRRRRSYRVQHAPSAFLRETATHSTPPPPPHRARAGHTARRVRRYPACRRWRAKAGRARIAARRPDRHRRPASGPRRGRPTNASQSGTRAPPTLRPATPDPRHCWGASPCKPPGRTHLPPGRKRKFEPCLIASQGAPEAVRMNGMVDEANGRRQTGMYAWMN